MTRRLACSSTAACLVLILAVPVSADTGPRYKPSSRSPAPIDILTNAYGASDAAPHALGIGEAAPDFAAPRAGGGLVNTRTLRADGELVLVFYRGHW